MPTPTAFFEGQLVPLEQARVGVMTHALNYGTAVFEGIRGNWNEQQQQLYLFRVREHVRRLLQSAKIMRLAVRYSEDELIQTMSEVTKRSGYREDVYLRPLVYKSGEVLGVRMDGVPEDVLVFVAPFGVYLDPEAGVRCMTSSWRRIDDNSIPARAKVSGLYVNNAMAKSEAVLNGYDEAVLLNQDGHVSEGSGENIAMIRHGRIVTPPPQDNILEGITLETVFEIAREELGLEVERRSIDRSELYIADEIFMTGTAAHVTPVTELDRVQIGDGQPGTITRELQRRYFDAISGRIPAYERWLTPVYSSAPVGA